MSQNKDTILNAILTLNFTKYMGLGIFILFTFIGLVKLKCYYYYYYFQKLTFTRK